MNRLLCLFFSFCCTGITAQQYTIPNQFGYRVETNLVYGTAVNYTGAVDTLKLDLYKPSGNTNTQRPLAVLVHGGSWLTGCKTDMAWLAKELVGRGYVVAAVNYRLGWHKAAAVAVACGTQDFPDFFPNEYAALYAADSLEILRAIYRGQQDVKGAIRWLKTRHALDSTAVNAVIVGGESAGGFLSLAVGFMDRPEEKPDCCNAIAAVPAPGANMLNLTTQNCVVQTWPINAPTLQRPDLGPVEGTLNTGQYDASVAGVINLYGGVPAIALTQNWVEGPNQPAVYLYHQSCDAVVPAGYGHPFYPYSGVCNGYANCSPWHQYTPNVYGSAAIASYFSAIPNPPLFTTELVYCDPFNTDLGILACLAFANNGGYHFVANKSLTSQKIADFFCPVLTPIVGGSCSTGAYILPVEKSMVPAPNPFTGLLSLYCDTGSEGPVSLSLTDLSGRQVWSDNRMLHEGQNLLANLPDLPNGLYVLKVSGQKNNSSWRVCKQ